MSFMVYADNEKAKAYQRQYYLANKARRIAVAIEGNKRHKAWIRETVHAAKEVPCADCGLRYPYYVMQFDHVRGEKKFGIATSGYKYINKQDLLDEIAKCEVVCSNCHAERTHGPKLKPA